MVEWEWREGEVKERICEKAESRGSVKKRKGKGSLRREASREEKWIEEENGREERKVKKRKKIVKARKN